MQILIKYYKQTAKESLHTLDLGKGSIKDCKNRTKKSLTQYHTTMSSTME